jgi:hypothetical protein
MENNRNNGRVDIFNIPKTCDLFNLYDKIPNKQCTNFKNATEGIWNDTLLSKAFFSRENMQIIQNAIRMGVYKRSNHQYIIGEQSCDDIKIIMRSIFLQHSKNDGNIQAQIRQLNDLVIAYCVKKVYSEALGYMNYIRDASTLVVPMQHPVLCSMADKELPFQPIGFGTKQI